MDNNFEEVPRAAEPFAKEREPDYFHETIWENPTERDVVLDLNVGTSPIIGGTDEQRRAIVGTWGKEERTGIRRFVIPAAGRDPNTGALIPSRARIPSEFDQGIQQTRCLEGECASRPMLCRNSRHRMEVFGGYGPQLINVRRVSLRTLDPALVAAPPPLAAPPAAAPSPSGAGDAALARAAARRGAR